MQKFKKLSISLVLALVMVSAVAATLIANYVIPNTAFVTTKPGICVYDVNNVQVFTITWGDVQQSMSKDFQITVHNVKGQITLYIIDSSLVTDLSASIGTLTWDFASKYGSPYLPYAMVPGGGTGPGDGLITLHLAISETAPEGAFSFTITINAYDSASG
jgi:hypothetical protein